MEERSDMVDRIVAPRREQSNEEIRLRNIEKSKDVLLRDNEGEDY
jgi:hypothetical protein